MARSTGRRTQELSGNGALATWDLPAIDRYVGARVRERRIMRGISQHEMARWLGISDQQAHRYEKGTTRISAGTLYRLAQLFQVDVSDFFRDCQRQPPEKDQWQPRFLELARSFERLEGQQERTVLLKLSAYLAQVSNEPAVPEPFGGRTVDKRSL